MIPERIHRDLPGDLAWIITEHRIGGRRQLVIYLADDIPADSALEQYFVRQATRAWRHRHDGLFALPPVFTAGGAAGWLMRQLRRPGIAAGAAVAAAGVALAVVVPIVEPPTRPQDHPVIAAPPVRPTTPGRSTAPHKPVKAAPKPPAPARPVSHPVAVVAVSTGHVHVDPARLPVRLPVRIPPVHVRPPVSVPHVPAPPVTSPVTATQCRLVTLELRVVQVCL